ncbi:hypothetical protein [Actinopolymorpha alba]|uniref:hypothetical protein n=1 Tax=Actinopolymorpha alba TaxID=533267 RepID=UPI00037338CE|nr:hypothetical protein [Actinopolymorpha alba]
MDLRRFAVSAGALSLAFTMAACGGGDSTEGTATTKPDTSAAASASPTKSPADDSTQGNGSDNAASPAKGTKVDATALTTTMLAAAEAKKTAKIKSGSAGTPMGDLTGEVRMGGASNVAAKLEMGSGATKTGMIILPDALYMKTPGMTTDPQKPWVNLEAAGDSPSAKMLATSMAQMRQNMDPTSQFEVIKYATITSEGPDQVEGSAATKYAVSVNVSDVAKAQPDLKEAYQLLESQGIKEIKYSLWLDDESLPVRVSMQLPGAAGGMDLVYYDWGKPVDISAPPASQVGKLKDTNQ